MKITHNLNTMMLLKEFVETLDGEAPFALQEDYDNAGIQVGSPDQEVSRGLVCLDVTPEVVVEAIQKKCDLIISHHPLIFGGIKRITGETTQEKVLLLAIKQGIAIVSLHTNLDNVIQGVNHELGKRLGLENMRILRPAGGKLNKLVTFCPASHSGELRAALFEAGAGHIGNYDCCSFNAAGKGTFRAGEGTSPFVGKLHDFHVEPEERIETIFPVHLRQKVLTALKSVHPYEEVAYDIYPLENTWDKAGSGMIGRLKKALKPEEFLHLVKDALGTPVLRYATVGDMPVETVAVCGGSGAFLLQHAMASGAQAFITAEIKYHQFFEAAGKILLVDAGHYETEQYTKELLVELVKKKMINFALLISEAENNPVRYY